MFTAKINGGGGPVRSSLGTNSAIAIVPPGASASNTFFNSFAAPRLPLAVQDVAERGDAMARAEIGFEQVAVHGVKAVADTEATGDLACDRRDLGPIDRRDVNRGRLLGQGDPPNAGTRRDVEHLDLVGAGRGFQLIGQRIGQHLRGLIAHRQDVFHELSEKLGAESLLIDRPIGLAGTDNLFEIEPRGDHLLLM